jgi:hypothetical protein
MNPVMGHQWEDLYQVPRMSGDNAKLRGQIVGATHLCAECTYSQSLRAEARCRCTHPSSEFADGVLFSGAPACAAFAPRHGSRQGLLNGSGGIAVLHGN